MHLVGKIHFNFLFILISLLMSHSSREYVHVIPSLWQRLTVPALQEINPFMFAIYSGNQIFVITYIFWHFWFQNKRISLYILFSFSFSFHYDFVLKFLMHFLNNFLYQMNERESAIFFCFTCSFSKNFIARCFRESIFFVPVVLFVFA